MDLRQKIQHLFLDPGKPIQNAYIESFNGRFRDECLNDYWFKNLSEARDIIELWRQEYNFARPHSALGYLTPNEYAQKLQKLEDLITGWMTKEGEVESVSVDGNKDYSPDVWYPNDIEVIITYHAFPKDKKKTESTATSSTEQKVPQQNKHDEAAKATLESTFPIENAKRAAVVAITNSFATDVFKADRLILKNILGTVANGSLDVKYDGKKYIVSNVKGTFGKDLDLSEIEKEKNASLFLAVSPELIKNDRNQREVNALD